jgi:hypothetical protein
LELQCLIQSSIAHNIFALNDNVPNTAVLGDTTDISHLCKFAWYDWVWYLDPVDFPEDKRKLGCWLGPAHNIGDALCACILGRNSQIISRTTYSPLSTSDLNSQQVKLLQESFEKNACFVMNKDDCVKNTHVFEVEPSEFETYLDNYTGDQETMRQADKYNHKAFNKYINAEVVIPKHDHIGAGQIIGQKKA